MNSNQASEQSVAAGLLTVAEASNFLKIGRSKLYSMMDAGELQYAKIGRARRIPKKSLIDLAAQCLTEGPAA